MLLMKAHNDAHARASEGQQSSNVDPADEFSLEGVPMGTLADLQKWNELHP